MGRRSGDDGYELWLCVCGQGCDGSGPGAGHKGIQEADQYEGTSLIVAYAQCIGQGFDLVHGNAQQHLAVEWLLAFAPVRSEAAERKNPLQLDSRAPSVPLEDYIYNETRYSLLLRSNPDEAANLLTKAKEEVAQRWNWYQHWASMPLVQGSGNG